ALIESEVESNFSAPSLRRNNLKLRDFLRGGLSSEPLEADCFKQARRRSAATIQASQVGHVLQRFVRPRNDRSSSPGPQFSSPLAAHRRKRPDGCLASRNVRRRCRLRRSTAPASIGYRESHLASSR